MKPGDLVKFSHNHIDDVYAFERWGDRIFFIKDYFNHGIDLNSRSFTIIDLKDNCEYQFYEHDLILVNSLCKDNVDLL